MNASGTRAPFARILCAIDHSDSSQRALTQAIALARWSGSRLTVLHVLPSHTLALIELPKERAMQEARQRAAAAVAACSHAFADGPLDAEVVIDIGEPAALITRHAGAVAADLLVLGTHGASGFDRLVMGSVAEKVLRRATSPVLTVPPHAGPTPASAFQRILCPIDFSDCSLAAFDLARMLAATTGAGITLMHVIEWPWVEPPAPLLGELPVQQAVALAEYRRYLTTSASAALKGLAESAAGDGIPVDTRVLHGRAGEQVLQAETDLHADLIVIGVHGRSAVGTTVFGSVTHRVLLGACCPVLTLCR